MVLNCQHSSWKGVTSDAPQGPILGPHLNDLSDGLSLNCKLFTDDTSLLSVVHDVTISSS